jgi:hypothetical protein
MREPINSDHDRLVVARRVTAGIALLSMTGAASTQTLILSPIPSEIFSVTSTIFFAAYLVLLWIGYHRKYTNILTRTPALTKSDRRSLVLMSGIAMIFLGLLWPFICPLFFNLNTNGGAFMDLGVAFILAFMGMLLLGYRVRTMLVAFMYRDPNKSSHK